MPFLSPNQQCQITEGNRVQREMTLGKAWRMELSEKDDPWIAND